MNAAMGKIQVNVACRKSKGKIQVNIACRSQRGIEVHVACRSQRGKTGTCSMQKSKRKDRYM